MPAASVAQTANAVRHASAIAKAAISLGEYAARIDMAESNGMTDLASLDFETAGYGAATAAEVVQVMQWVAACLANDPKAFERTALMARDTVDSLGIATR